MGSGPWTLRPTNRCQFHGRTGDLSVDGRNWTTAKDYAELHEVVRDDFRPYHRPLRRCRPWFPLERTERARPRAAFWRSDWNELQKFYDYTTDAILRAFEDRGYDSNRVFIGGSRASQDLSRRQVVFGQFLAHCSPTSRTSRVPCLATPPTPILGSTANDPSVSRRSVEPTTEAASPCDFISSPLPTRLPKRWPTEWPGQRRRRWTSTPNISTVWLLLWRAPLAAAARSGLWRQLPGERLLPNLVRRCRPTSTPTG